ncbi:hypothetical protein OJAV_G00169880 [Oryzias javanicus]|uniref:Myb/SANT-like DNA-binding domain-containing protein n=1 Tax=Oryzias javanicus TaxID=123683 RepID=A0A437CGJ0_ORYJA|nr:hypothetical protein OJAV_G00169880 [Oryzias javanicus]
MSSIEALREFISERLTAAAEDIFRQVEKTIVQYEDEMDRQRRMLDRSWERNTITAGKMEPEDEACISSRLPQMTVDIQPPSVRPPASPVPYESHTEFTHQTTIYLLDLCNTHINLYHTNKHMFYKKLEQNFHNKGYTFTLDKIRKKLGNLLTTYKRNKARLTSTGDTKISWEYYLQIDKIFGGLGVGSVQVGTVISTPLVGWIQLAPSTTLQLAQPDPSTVPKLEPSTVPKLEPSTAPKPDPSTASKPEPSTAPKPDPSTASKLEPSTAPKPDPSTASKLEPSTAPKPDPSTASKLKPSTAPQPGPSTALLETPARAVCSKRKKSEDLQDTYERHAEQRTAARRAMVYPDLKNRCRLQEKRQEVYQRKMLTSVYGILKQLKTMSNQQEKIIEELRDFNKNR